LVRRRDFDEAVQASGPDDRGIEDVLAVRGRYDLDIAEVVEAVDLREELHERPLDFALAAGPHVDALGSQGINLVDEDDRGRVVATQLEDLLDELRALADELLHELRAHYFNER